MRYKAGEALKVNYIALKKTLGLVDLTMQVYDEAGVEFTGSPFTMTEVIAPTEDGGIGLYTATFTPDAVGQWRVRIQSPTNGDDISKIFEVQLTKEDDIKAQTQSIEDKVDNLDSDVAAVKGVVDQAVLDIANLDGDIVAVAGQITNLDGDVVAVKAQTQSIEDKVDAIDLQISSGGYIL
jgi:hypothetical protein